MLFNNSTYTVVTKRKSQKLAAGLGRNLAAKRKELGLNQEQLAESIGVEPETISRFERGATLPSLVTLAKLAEFLGIQISELLEEDLPKVVDEAIVISTLISHLKGKDRAFLVELVKFYCQRHS